MHDDAAEDRELFQSLMNKHQNPGKKYAKGGAIEIRGYAKGGQVLGRTREFMKEPDPFSYNTPDGGDSSPGKHYEAKPQPGSPQDYVKGKNKHPGKDKSLKTVTPRE